MSETIGTPFGGPAADPASAEKVHEAYSFACLRCGHGWEQSYEIVHHTDDSGRTTVTYYADRQRVPSPLTRPVCQNCGSHTVRIMRSGRVSDAHRWSPWVLPFPEQSEPSAPGRNASRSEQDDWVPEDRHESAEQSSGKPRHHWRLAGLLHFFHRGHGHGHDRAA